MGREALAPMSGQTKEDGGVACKPRFFDLLARDVVHFVPTVQKGD